MDNILPHLTERDIVCYVSGQLSEVEFMISSTEVFPSLAISSGQIFEWARLACAYIRGDNNAGTGLKPEERLNAILSLGGTHPVRVRLLDKMYRFTLETIFPETEEQNQRDVGLKRFKSVMAQILGTIEPLSLDSLRSMRCHFKDLAAEIDIRTTVAPMAALLSGATDSSVAIRPLHASFAEFLIDRDRSGEFFVDVHSIHNDLTFASLGIMRDKLEFNICDLPSSYLLNSEVLDLDDRIKKWIPAELDILADSGRTTFDRRHSTRLLQQRSEHFSTEIFIPVRSAEPPQACQYLCRLAVLSHSMGHGV